jgi:glycosyltransferase involved in cell wall biosynthesis
MKRRSVLLVGLLSLLLLLSVALCGGVVDPVKFKPHSSKTVDGNFAFPAADANLRLWFDSEGDEADEDGVAEIMMLSRGKIRLLDEHTVSGPASTTADSIDNQSEFRFLSVGRWAPQQGFEYLLRAFLSEFNADEDRVVLYLLTNPYHGMSDFHSDLEHLLSSFTELQSRSRTSLPDVRLITQTVPHAEMPAVYHGADVFVSTSRLRGTCQTSTLEALACGLPVIAPAWTGSSYLTAQNAFLVQPTGATVVPRTPEGGTQVWETPDVLELQALLRTTYEDAAEAALRGQRARRHVLEQYGEEALAAQD